MNIHFCNCSILGSMITNSLVVLLFLLNANVSCSQFFLGGMLLGRTLSVLITTTLGTAMAARQGALAMAAHQICVQVWLAVSLLSDALAVSAQVQLFLAMHFFLYFNNTAYFD